MDLEVLEVQEALDMGQAVLEAQVTSPVDLEAQDTSLEGPEALVTFPEVQDTSPEALVTFLEVQDTFQVAMATFPTMAALTICCHGQ